LVSDSGNYYASSFAKPDTRSCSKSLSIAYTNPDSHAPLGWYNCSNLPVAKTDRARDRLHDRSV
jgi:hypothetical protein